MQLKNLLISIFLVAMSFSASAVNTKIRFLNGIQNDTSDMEKSVDTLYASYRLYKTSTMPTIPKENFGFYENKKDGLILGDLIELAVQGTLAGIAEKYAQITIELNVLKAKKAGLAVSDDTKNTWYASTYKRTLSEIYSLYLSSSSSDGRVNISGVANSVLEKIRTDLQDGSSIVVVSHSQGNFFAEAVHSQLTAAEKNRVRFVGVASVAPTTPNGRYVTFGKDLAVFGAFALLKEKFAIFAADPLPKNEDGYYAGPEGITSFWDSISTPPQCFLRLINCPSAMGHSFTDVYLNRSVVNSESELTPIASKIIGMIGESISELNTTQPSQSLQAFISSLETTPVNLAGIAVSGSDIYVASLTKDLSQSRSNPDGTPFYRSAILVTKIADKDVKWQKTVASDFYIANETGNLWQTNIGFSSDSTKLLVAASSYTGSSYLMTGGRFAIDIASPDTQSYTSLYTSSNIGWFPYISNGQLNHFSYMGYYGCIETGCNRSISPTAFATESHNKILQAIGLTGNLTAPMSGLRTTMISRLKQLAGV